MLVLILVIVVSLSGDDSDDKTIKKYGSCSDVV